MISAKSRVKIKDLPDPVGFTLTLTENPCVDNTCSVKSKAAMKAGKSISKQNKSIIEKARDALNGLLEPAEANNGANKMSEEDKKKEFVTKSDLGEFKDEMLEAIKAAPAKPDPNATATPAAPAPTKCPDCGAVVGAKDKFCKACGADLKPAASKSKGEEDVEGGESKALKNHDDGKEKVVFKSVEHYMGRNKKGRPIKKAKGE